MSVVFLPKMLLVALVAADACAVMWPTCAPEACVPGQPYEQRGWLTRDYAVKGRRLSVSANSEALRWRCARGADAGDSAMPRYQTKIRKPDVELIDCQIPSVSYEQLLRSLNISTLNIRRLAVSFDTNKAFDSDLLKDMPPLKELSIHSEQLITLEKEMFDFNILERLTLYKVFMTTKQFSNLNHIKELSVTETGLEQVPDLSQLKNLERLVIREPDLLDASLLATAPALVDVTLEAPDAAIASLPLITNATFVNVYAMERIFGSCSNLEGLSLINGSLVGLRAGWLAGCVRLRRLQLTGLRRLRTLPSDLLADATALTLLDLSHNALEALPDTLLSNTVVLTRLDLSHNQLKALPDTLLTRTTTLVYLDLSYNLLKVLPDDLFAYVHQRRCVDIRNNMLPELDDGLICGNK